MIPRRISLQGIAILLVLAGFAIGGAFFWVWANSNAQWRLHQERSFVTGVALYYALQNGTAPPPGVVVRKLASEDQGFAQQGAFRRVSSAPMAARLTHVPILADAANPVTGRALTLTLLSPDLVYKLADLPRHDGQTAAETLGALTRQVASFCSDPVILAQMGNAPWVELDGRAVWGCDAAPTDWRMMAALLAVIGLAVLLTLALDTASTFTRFAEQLRARRRFGGPTSYATPGPQELQEVVQAVNRYLEAEREQLSHRAAIMSGVSHDLGTPATRLRLRTALIEDTELRQKLEADIDRMTSIIDSVLTYTRTEMSVEAPRQLSLNALVDAIVANYEDLGRPVSFRLAEDVVVQGARSVFMSRQGQGIMSANRQIIINGRPVALERAITNLIDNALKYGGRATVVLDADHDTATIAIEDDGPGTSAAEISALLHPFERGANTGSISGHGLGLTIVDTIAKIHGGALQFEDTPTGLRAVLHVQRR